MANTSAHALLKRIVSGELWTPEMIDGAAGDPDLFRDLVEPLADAFDPRLVEAYVHVFSEIAERVRPGLHATDLAARFERVRRTRRFDGPEPWTVYVLSRVTLGADIAITSVVLDAVLQRFPSSEVFLVGPRKCWEMFARNSRVQLLVAPYDRNASLREKLDVSFALELPFRMENSVVVDPDSRLTQLGLIPVCPEERYYFFESRSIPGPGSLSQLASRWTGETFGVGGKPWIACPPTGEVADVTVSLGVGGNEGKRVPDPFERTLMELLARTGRRILIDKGAGGEEADRVDRAIAGLPSVRTWNGDFARFAGSIAQSSLYVGYDSAGQHAAAAAGTRVVSIFSGYPNHRFLERWRPTGPARVDVIDAEHGEPERAIRQVAAALQVS